MNDKRMFVAALLLVATTAAAQTTLQTVEVRADSAESVDIACSQPDVSIQDTERVLAISDHSQSPALRRRLVDAATEACHAGAPRIEVARGSSGSLTWKAAK
jgi:hypothetical protein